MSFLTHHCDLTHLIVRSTEGQRWTHLYEEILHESGGPDMHRDLPHQFNGLLQHFGGSKKAGLSNRAPIMLQSKQTRFATLHFGNKLWPALSLPECVGLRINTNLLDRQQWGTAVQSGNFLWGGVGRWGYRASGWSCCLRWEDRLALCVCVAAAEAWNGTQVVE